MGKIFFDVVGTPCFELVRSRECRVRAWWGACLGRARGRRLVWRDLHWG